MGGYYVAIANEEAMQEEMQYVTLTVDKYKINQALRSIVSNSSRMTMVKGLVTLKCFLYTPPAFVATLEPSCELHIEISNDGPGISAVRIVSLFH